MNYKFYVILYNSFFPLTIYVLWIFLINQKNLEKFLKNEINTPIGHIKYPIVIYCILQEFFFFKFIIIIIIIFFYLKYNYHLYRNTNWVVYNRYPLINDKEGWSLQPAIGSFRLPSLICTKLEKPFIMKLLFTNIYFSKHVKN